METTRGGLTGNMLDGRYRIGAVIARGGMSTVYRGLDTRLDRPVAVKVMAGQYADDPAFLTRFSREARLAAGLSHPGVVAVYDHGRDGDHAFLVMELVDGGTLRDLLHEHGALSVPVAVAILTPLLDALAAAHRAGLVHRDVKPENVLISSRGAVKVADFGLVRAVSSQTMATGDVILGTVAYLSPEQVETGSSDTRSDVYSAGVVAWEMLTGEPPFTGENAMSVAYQHVHADVPLVGDVVEGVPAELEDLIGDATQRDPDLRPRDAANFADDLRAVCEDIGLPVAPVPVPSRPEPARPTDDPAGPIPHAGRTRGVVRPTTVDRSGGRGSQWAAGADTARAGGPAGTRMVPRGSTPTSGEPRNSVGSGGGSSSGGSGSGMAVPIADRRPRPIVVARKRRIPRWLIILVVMLLLGVAAAASGWWLADGRWAFAPVTVGMTQQQAEKAVREAGLVPEVALASSQTARIGTISRTDPLGGAKLLRGSSVALMVSSGRPAVPPIRAGTSPTVAAGTLTDAGFALRTGAAVPPPVHDDTVAAGSVIRTDPAAGTTMAIGATVGLVLSLGPRPVPVPYVAGKSQEDARNKLLVAGFTVGTPVEAFDATSSDGTVLGTEPVDGQQLPKGTPIRLVVNTSIAVPDVRTATSPQAAAQLEAAGFTVTLGAPLFDPDIDAGAVVATDPAAGSRVDPAALAITLHPSSAITVPDVTGRRLDEAKTDLTDIGLEPDVSGLFRFGSSQIVAQSPQAGTRIAPGGPVRIAVTF